MTTKNLQVCSQHCSKVISNKGGYPVRCRLITIFEHMNNKQRNAKKAKFAEYHDGEDD